jgi:hypothetical protein
MSTTVAIDSSPSIPAPVASARHTLVPTDAPSPLAADDQTQADSTSSATDEQLIQDIRREHQAAETAMRLSIRHARRAGNMLIEVKKKRVPHGQFGKWIDRNCPFDRRTAQRYMLIAKHWDALTAKATDVSHLTMAQAIELLTVPDADQIGPDHTIRAPESVGHLSIRAYSCDTPSRWFWEANIEFWKDDARRFARNCDRLIRGANDLLGHYHEVNNQVRSWVRAESGAIRIELDAVRVAIDQLVAEVDALPPYDHAAAQAAILSAFDVTTPSESTVDDATSSHETTRLAHAEVLHM